MTMRALALLSVVALACGDDDRITPGSDGGSPAEDASFDSGGRDGGSDAGSDAGRSEPIAGPLDPYVDVAPGVTYGEHTFVVPARTNWVQTGLFLAAAETAEITATGTWTVDGSAMHGPEGTGIGLERGCRIGSVVARVGLQYEDTSLACIGSSGTLTAPRDGIVFVGGIVSTDLGETYESRSSADGEMTVTVTSSGRTVPTLGYRDAASYDFGAVDSGWVELRSNRFIVTLPVESAMRDVATIPAAFERLDRFYEVHTELRGAVPYFEQRVRFFPDPTIESFAYMVAGNPIRMVPDLATGTDEQRITRAGEDGTDVWGFAHEIGHDFTVVHGTWTYMPAGGYIEGWANVFTVHTLRALAHPQAERDKTCAGRDAYLASGSYDTFREDPWLVLCFLLEIEEAHGFAFYRELFARLNEITNDDIPYDPESDAALWRWLRDLFNEIAPADVTPILTRWKIPLE